jgi:hypothetical protein
MTVSAGPNLNVARSGHSATATIDGLIIVIGGSNPSLAGIATPAELVSVEILDESAATPAFKMSASSLSTPRTGHISVLLPNNGGILVIGGTEAGAQLSTA